MRMKWATWGLYAALVAASPAFGHAKLLATAPAAGAELAAAPASLTLTFNEAVRLAALRVTSAGRAVPITIDRGAAAAAVVTVALPPLSPGSYHVEWSALTVDDGHVVKGEYSFVVH